MNNKGNAGVLKPREGELPPMETVTVVVESGALCEVQIPDYNHPLAPGILMQRDPSFVIGYDGKPWYIKDDDVTVERVKCHNCKDLGAKKGFLLHDEGNVSTAILVHCENCDQYVWADVWRKQ